MRFVSIFVALLLPCVGMAVMFFVYICLLWYAATRSSSSSSMVTEKPKEKKGLSSMELEKMGSSIASEEVKGKDCAVCLDEIEIGQIVRWLPDCHHGFHLKCADDWLSQNSTCPLCRANLEISKNSPKEEEQEEEAPPVSADELV